MFTHNFLPALAVAAIGVSASAASAQAFRIDDIRVEGLQRVSAGPVFAALPLASGDTATPDNLRAAVRALFATGFFDDVQILRDGSILIVRVVERPTISEITIDGNKAIKTEALEEALGNNDLAAGQIFQRSTLDGILNELERQYVAQGRYAAEVEADVEELPNNQVKVAIKVDEGDVAKIKHINIVGNEIFSDEQLLELFELRTSGWLSWFRNDDKYAREKLRGDIEKLESFYLDRGYLDFRITSSQVSLAPDQKSVYITLNVEEGEVYKVSNIELAGELIVPEPNIRRLILLREGATFSQNLMTASSEYITTLMGNAGYTNAKVEGIPEPKPGTNEVDITFFINPGKRVYVRRVDFKGNTRTQDDVLRREMRQLESASASNARIEQGKIRLERLGFFKEVNVENIEVPGSDDLIDVLYTVEEQPSGSISANIGYGQTAGLLIGASLQQNNWLGTGKQVGASINYSEYQTSYNFSYTDPYFTPDGVSRGVNLFYTKRDYSKIYVSAFSTDSYGFNFNFGYPLSEIQRLNFSLGYSHISISTGSQTAQEIRRTPFELPLDERPYYYVDVSTLRDFQLGQLEGVSRFEDVSLVDGVVTEDMLVDTDPGFVDEYGDTFDLVNFRLGWLRSTLNRGIFATRGSRQSLNLDVVVPGSELTYYTLQYEGQIYQPLSENFTLRFRTSLGYGDGYGDIERLPFFRNFYAGGLGSVRGYERSSLGPKASPPSQYETVPLDYIAYDTNFDGVNDSYSQQNPGLIYCDRNAITSSGGFCQEGGLSRTFGALSRRQSNIGGNTLVEFGAELLFPLPFIEDQRSFQTSVFVDVGNVFDTDCGRTQPGCSSFDFDELRASAGISVNWLSAMGPLTFSYALPLRQRDSDEIKRFEFSLGAQF